MSKKRDFEHDSLQDAVSLVEYLQTVSKGFADGKLTVSNKDEVIALEPAGLIRFELRASQRADRSRLTLRFTWTPKRASEAETGEQLEIRSGQR
jgi:amphi-Trp domain-containing protein